MPSLPRHPGVPPHPLRRAVTELHVVGCDCPACEPYRADAEPALTLRQLAGLGTAGFVFATAIAAIVDPAGTPAVLVDLFRWWLLP